MESGQAAGIGVAVAALSAQQFGLLLAHQLGELLVTEAGGLLLGPPQHNAAGGHRPDRHLRPVGTCDLAHRPGGQGQCQDIRHRRPHRHPAPGQSDQKGVIPAPEVGPALGELAARRLAISPKGRVWLHGVPPSPTPPMLMGLSVGGPCWSHGERIGGAAAEPQK